MGSPGYGPRPAQLPVNAADFAGRENRVRFLCDLLSGANSDPGMFRIAIGVGSDGLAGHTRRFTRVQRLPDTFPMVLYYCSVIMASGLRKTVAAAS